MSCDRAFILFKMELELLWIIELRMIEIIKGIFLLRHWDSFLQKVLRGVLVNRAQGNAIPLAFKSRINLNCNIN